MNVYDSENIRNVVLLGHGGSGKTILLEGLAYAAGMINRIRTIEEGGTISDYDKEEIKRGFSISTSVVPVEWGDVKINLLDTPGFFDFVGEVEEAVAAADAAIIVINGKSGIEVGTQKAWEICEKYNLPRLICVTGMDDDNASFRQIVKDMQELYGKKIAPFHIPLRANEKFIGLINIISKEAYKWDRNGNTIPTDVPEYSMPNLELLREALMATEVSTFFNLQEKHHESDMADNRGLLSCECSTVFRGTQTLRHPRAEPERRS